MALRCLAGVGLLIDRHQAHQPHLAADTLLVDQLALITQVQRQLSNTVKRLFHELPVDHAHQVEVHLGLALRFIAKRRPRDRQQGTFVCQQRDLAGSVQSSRASGGQCCAKGCFVSLCQLQSTLLDWPHAILE